MLFSCLFIRVFLSLGGADLFFLLLRVALVDLASGEAVSYYIMFSIHELWCLRTSGQHQYSLIDLNAHYRDVR